MRYFIIYSILICILQDHASYFGLQVTRATFEFDLGLRQLVAVGTPALKALTCLEANEANAGDFYLFWHAML